MTVQNSHDDLDERIIRDLPSPSTAFLIASEWYRQGRYEAVIHACGDILKIYPDDIRLRRLACLANLELESHEDVLEETETIARSLEGFADIYLLRAKALKRLNETGKALEALRLYLAYRPGDEAGLRLLQELRQIDKSPASPDQEPVDMDLDSETPVASPTIAELYFSQGLLDEAIKTYRQVVDLNPDDQISRQRLEELEGEASRIRQDSHRQAQASAESVYGTVLKQWREKCRRLLEPKV
jgi:tetratricopeptide (TPR) repeat protein